MNQWVVNQYLQEVSCHSNELGKRDDTNLRPFRWLRWEYSDSTYYQYFYWMPNIGSKDRNVASTPTERTLWPTKCGHKWRNKSRWTGDRLAQTEGTPGLRQTRTRVGWEHPNQDMKICHTFVPMLDRMLKYRQMGFRKHFGRFQTSLFFGEKHLVHSISFFAIGLA